MRSGALLAAALVCFVACGDNTLPIGVDLVRARDLTIVAHSDDDLVYLQPDQLERTTRDGGTIVYLTDGSSAADLRHVGLQAAYTAATGRDAWLCGWIQIAGHNAEHCRLDDALLSLVFLGYPEGDADGAAPSSIARLWDGSIPIAITIGDLTSSYTRDDVIATLAELVEATQPRTVRTFDLAGVHGFDHADHAITSAATLLAVAASSQNPDIISYRGDGTNGDPATLIDPLFARSAGVLAFYDGCVEGSAECGQPATAITEAHAAALRRRYAFSMRLATGELRTNNDCIAVNANGGLDVVACPTDETWRLAADGTLHVGDRCIVVLPVNGELVADDDCTSAPTRRFFLDDEGHLWTGVPPPVSPGDPLQCIAIVDGARPRATRCGPGGAAIWELSPTPIVSVRPVGLPAAGRAIRLADLTGDGLGDLCAVVASSLRCAAGDGAGTFGALATLGTLAVEPESLAIGDVDNDGRADACGRDAAGLLCATALGGFVAERWSPGFARAGAANAGDRSLAAADADDNGTAEICGLATDGFVCAQHDPFTIPDVRSPWPEPTMDLWPGDLDGDRRADWCALTASGFACGIDALATVTTDGVPWSFSFGGNVDPTPANTTLGALGDIDNDGRDDLCGVIDRDGRRQIACARSQGFGFGPLATLATLPTTVTFTALWLGDLDGDGTADACADDGTQVYCARAR